MTSPVGKLSVPPKETVLVPAKHFYWLLESKVMLQTLALKMTSYKLLAT
jgi:hypothetical protein